MVFPVLNHFSLQLLARAREDSVLCHRALEVLELVLNLLAFSLLLIQLGLQLARHSVVAVLSFLQVVTNLMHVGKRVQVLVLVEQLLLGLVLVLAVIQQDNLPLKTVISRLQSMVLLHLVADRLNQFKLHLGRRRQVAHAVIVVFVLFVSKPFFAVQILAHALVVSR